MTTSHRLPASFLTLLLALAGLSAIPSEAEAACDVNAGGYCQGDCDVNVLATCHANASCMVNAVATCGGFSGAYASCTVNVGLATCAGWCGVNVADASCEGSCSVNVGAADCAGWCLANAGLAECAGGCLVNAGASTCGSSYCRDHFCILRGCLVNAVLAECHGEGSCLANVASDCWGGCDANVVSPSLYVGLIPIDLGCGEQGACTVNLAARCDGACAVNAAIGRCEAGSTCPVNVLGTCARGGPFLP